MSFTIRAVEESDLPAIYKMICALEETVFSENEFKFIFRLNISNKDNFYRVAETMEGSIVGFISCHSQYLLHHGGKVAEIQELFVEESYRKCGIGRLLVNKITEQLIAQKCILVEVSAANTRLMAHTFYESMGLTCTHKKFIKALSE